MPRADAEGSAFTRWFSERFKMPPSRWRDAKAARRVDPRQSQTA